MPRYNYECTKCGVFMELTHSMKTVVNNCPECNAENTLNKIFSIPNIKNEQRKETGATVKIAIDEYKQRIKEERGIWDEFDVDSLLGKNK